MDLVDLKTWLVFELVCQWAFPLTSGQRIEASILQTLQALVSQCGLNLVKLL